MKKATVELRGVGRVYIDTDRDKVRIANAVTTAGEPVNCRTAKVSRSTRYYAKADLNDAVWLKKLDDETFLIVADE
jgi:hypothetical protein